MAKVNSESPLPLPLQIREDIHLKILSGRLKPEDKLFSEERLAREYGVSRMTARQALIELITEGTLYRIPGKGTFVAKQPEAKKKSPDLTNNLIMLIVPNLRHSFYYQIIHSVEKTVTKNGYEVLLRCANEDPLEEQDCLQKLLEGGPRGLILIAEKYSHLNLALLQKINRRMPLVIVDVAVPDLEADLVVSDDRQGGFLITSHLIESGYRQILHLAGPEGDSSAEERLAGYRQALEKFQLEFRPEWVRFTEWHSEEGYYEAKKFFLNGSNKEEITAIFAGNDEIAAGAFKALIELGIKVPEEKALAGYANMDMGRFLDVPLTTVNQFAPEMGKAASQLLLDKLAGRRPGEERKEIRIPTKLVIRQSCGLQRQPQEFILQERVITQVG